MYLKNYQSRDEVVDGPKELLDQTIPSRRKGVNTILTKPNLHPNLLHEESSVNNGGQRP